ncbi:hypothetical protein [Citricoccus sp.]|uniref:hypothetical protein n=1 Tax=Citricoccus sp. TaxID=1978372 RepID=UPI0028BDCF8D|nr:hypothetical protein [Citricoccus sp.]
MTPIRQFSTTGLAQPLVQALMSVNGEMNRPEPPSIPEIFTLTEGRALELSRHRLYRSGLTIPFHRLRTAPPADPGAEEAMARFSNSEYARTLSRQDPSLVISHQTAAETWGMWLPWRMQTTRIHLSRVRCRAGIPRYQGTVGHFIRPGARDVRGVDGYRITSPEWTWVDLASQRLTVDELVAAGDALLQRGDGFPRPATFIGTNPLATKDSILDVLGRRKGSPGIRKLRLAVDLLRERVDSEPESRLRLKMVEGGWDEPAVNPRIRFADGWECDVDLALLQWRISLQYEGKHHFTLEKQYRSDLNRDEQIRARGWEPIRVDSAVFTRQGWHAFGYRLTTAVERQQQQTSWVPFTAGT